MYSISIISSYMFLVGKETYIQQNQHCFTYKNLFQGFLLGMKLKERHDAWFGSILSDISHNKFHVNFDAMATPHNHIII